MASRSVQVSSELADRFAREYIKDLNATQAYLRCKPDVTEGSARTLGARLLAEVGTQAHIATLRAEAATRLQISADAVLRELAIVGFSDHRHYDMTESGDLELRPDVDPEAGRAVARVKRKTRTYGQGDRATTETTLEYGLWDKPKALIALAQHLGLIGTGSETQLPPGGREIRVRWVDE